MLFKKRQKPREKATPSRPAAVASRNQKTYLITFEMMLKGHVAQRGRQRVRQVGVSVGGTTHIVTSGDVVDQATYDALLAVQAIAPDKQPPAQEAPPEESP